MLLLSVRNVVDITYLWRTAVIGVMCVMSAVKRRWRLMQRSEVLDKGHVQYMDHMGTDLSIVNAARVSFDKESEWEFPTHEEVLGSLTQTGNRRLSSRDTKLIHYLAKHKHWTPFGQVTIQLRIKMPLFVSRQMMRSNVGIVWNEVSRRYVDSEPEFYEPEVWRGRPEGSIKQGSGDGAVTSASYKIPSRYDYLPPTTVRTTPHQMGREIHSLAMRHYTGLVKSGVAPEQARIVLPQSTYTEVVGNFTLAALARVCALREDSHAQLEIQEFAKAMGEIAKQYFPVSWEALTGGGE
jgi:thymidylate synthase (FAD)